MKHVHALPNDELKRNPGLPAILLFVALAASSCGKDKGTYPAGPGSTTETRATTGGIEAAVSTTQSFAVNAESVGGVFFTGGGVYDQQSGFVRGGGAFALHAGHQHRAACGLQGRDGPVGCHRDSSHERFQV